MKMKDQNRQEKSVVCNEFVKVRVSRQLKQQFTEVAIAQGRNPSEAFREAMAEWVSRAAGQA